MFYQILKIQLLVIILGIHILVVMALAVIIIKLKFLLWRMVTIYPPNIRSIIGFIQTNSANLKMRVLQFLYPHHLLIIFLRVALFLHLVVLVLLLVLVVLWPVPGNLLNVF